MTSSINKSSLPSPFTWMPLLLLCFSLCSCSSIRSSTSVPSKPLDEECIKKQVLLAFDGLVNASKSLDTKVYFAHFDADKFVGLNSDGSTWQSFKELQDLIVPAFAAIESVTSLTFTHVKVSVIDHQTAILVNEFEQSVLLKNGQSAAFAGGGTQVWSKQSGTWKLVSVSASNKPSP